MNVENTVSDVDVLGKLEVGDLAETAHKCTFSMNYFKAIDSAVSGKDSNDAKNPGGSLATAFTAAKLLGVDTSSSGAGVSSMRNQTAFTCQILDERDNAIYEMIGCKFEGGTGSVDARGVLQGTMNFKAVSGYGI